LLPLRLLKEGRAARSPTLPLSFVLRRYGAEERAGENLDRDPVSAGRNDQLPELVELACSELRRALIKRLQLRIKVFWFSHVSCRSMFVDSSLVIGAIDQRK
jgi:hypothetical protein